MIQIANIYIMQKWNIKIKCLVNPLKAPNRAMLELVYLGWELVDIIDIHYISYPINKGRCSHETKMQD